MGQVSVFRLVFRLALILSSLSLLALVLVRVIDLSQGDPVRGETLYFGASAPYLPCFQCHQMANVAPGLGGLVKRVEEERLSVPENAGQTVEEYLAESIIDPQRYIVPDYKDLMPNFVSSGSRIYQAVSLQDLQDIVAYLMTL